MSAYKPHPIADLFPRISETETVELATDSSVDSASHVLDEDPELAAEVVNGHLSWHAAETAIAKGKKELSALVQDEMARDETGRSIPADLVPLWNRRGKITEVLARIRRVENTLTAMEAKEDELFASIDLSLAISKVRQIQEDIRQAALYAVCPDCQGHGRAGCTPCKTRGFISKRSWDSVPAEKKMFCQGLLEEDK